MISFGCSVPQVDFGTTPALSVYLSEGCAWQCTVLRSQKPTLVGPDPLSAHSNHHRFNHGGIRFTQTIFLFLLLFSSTIYKLQHKSHWSQWNTSTAMLVSLWGFPYRVNHVRHLECWHANIFLISTKHKGITRIITMHPEKAIYSPNQISWQCHIFSIVVAVFQPGPKCWADRRTQIFPTG